MNPCELCGKDFAKKRYLNKHIQLHRVDNPRRNSKCLECHLSFLLISDLREHLERQHGIEYEQHLMEFPTFEDFSQWKIKEEISTNTQYVINSSSSKEGIKVYYCNRSGIYKERITDNEKRKRSLKSRGSNKIGSSCTAQIILKKSEDDTYNVTFFPTHYGHENETEHINLTRYLKDCITSDLFVDNGPVSTSSLDAVASLSKEELPNFLQSVVHETSIVSNDPEEIDEEINTINDRIKGLLKTGHECQLGRSLEEKREYLKVLNTIQNELYKFLQPELEAKNTEKKKEILNNLNLFYQTTPQKRKRKTVKTDNKKTEFECISIKFEND